jgi:hypothetical protein
VKYGACAFSKLYQVVSGWLRDRRKRAYDPPQALDCESELRAHRPFRFQ